MPQDLDETKQHPPSQEVILWVANALDDRPKPSPAHRAIGMVLGISDFYDVALLELDKSLQLCDSSLERFKTLTEITDVEIRYSGDKRFEGESKEHVGKAYKAVNTALELRSELKEDDAKIEEDRHLLLQGIVSDRLKLLSRALGQRVKLGKLEEALSTIDQVRALVKYSIISSDDFNDIVRALEAKKQYDKIIFGR
jgi:hypothetical protein